MFTRLEEKYLIKQEIGRSQAASLYRAVELASGRSIALKVFRRKFSADPRFALKFRNHMRKIFELESEYLVSVRDYGMVDGVYYIASEWVSGQNLDVYLSKNSSLGELQAIALASQVCQGLAYIHKHELLHQNLKPENILITSKGKIKLSDVGLNGLISESGLSRTHVMEGRYHYIAPEQVNGQEPGPASDIYSLGVILYEMLTGHFPFESHDIWDVVRMHVEIEPPSLNQNQNKISGMLAQIVQQALQKSPDKRFHSAGAMNTALTSILLDHVPMNVDGRASAASGIWLSLQQLWDRMIGFLRRPAPIRIMGKSFPFGWVLLVQFVISCMIAFLFFSAAVNFNKQYQQNRGQFLPTLNPSPGIQLLQKSIDNTGLPKGSGKPD